MNVASVALRPVELAPPARLSVDTIFPFTRSLVAEDTLGHRISSAVGDVTMGDRVWQVPEDLFVAIWNGAGSLDEAAARVRELVGGAAPGWALLQRALELRRAGVEMKELFRPAPLQRV